MVTRCSDPEEVLDAVVGYAGKFTLETWFEKVKYKPLTDAKSFMEIVVSGCSALQSLR